MTIEIEVYKGQSISYDDECDKFLCDISIEDKWKKTKRLSLNDVRKEIDTFIKLNLDFKPFKAMFLDTYDRRSFEIKIVSGIRTDGKFVVESENSLSKSYYGKKKMSYCMAYNHEIFEEQNRLEEELEAARDSYRKKVINLCKRLKPIDLSAYDAIINPE